MAGCGKRSHSVRQLLSIEPFSVSHFLAMASKSVCNAWLAAAKRPHRAEAGATSAIASKSADSARPNLQNFNKSVAFIEQWRHTLPLPILLAH
eukprot:7091742-Karenia_brevis.AAC.1